MVTAAALFQEVTVEVSRGLVPVVELFAPGTRLAASAMHVLWWVGNGAVLGYVIAVVWLLVAVAVTGRRVPAGSA